jgi:uncharacterized membrane protein SpoIIM required for sporulation
MAQTYPEWQRLSDLLEVIVAQGVERLEAEEIVEFGKLYRRAAAELSFHRTHEIDPEKLAFLNELVGRCYPYVYTAPRRPWPSVAAFYARDFPCALRRHFGWILLATLISLIPAAVSFALTLVNRAIADQVLPPQLMAGLEEQIRRHHAPQDWLGLLQGNAPWQASRIMTNNIGITITVFAGGMLLGIPTLFHLINTGVMLGVCAAAVALDGPSTAMGFWAFVAPHGVLELPAIFIAGGAGLLLAYAIINPGTQPRRVALRVAGAEALKLMLGVASMLVVAGCIEGFFSPTLYREEIKYTVAICVALLFVSYFLFAGREKQADATPATPFGDLVTPLPPV